MIGTDTKEVERKVLTILRVLSENQEPLGARLIAQRLKGYGVDLGERAVRYHLKLMDERGLTTLIGRDGRMITERGIEEVGDALVGDKVGFAITRIELLAFRTDFNLDEGNGAVPINVSFFPRRKFSRALNAMKPIFAAGLCVSDRVAVAQEGQQLGDLTIPEGQTGLATVCSVVINGTLLKAGVPMDSRFGGILQIRNRKPKRFVELLNYSGSSIDPSKLFIGSKMTSVRSAAEDGNGKILANFREIPAACQLIVERVTNRLKQIGIDGLFVMGNTSEPVCEIPVELNKIGMVLIGGLNPVAAAEELGIEAQNHGMSTVMEYKKLKRVWEI
jgi:repressor of nif and glnA expression